MRLIEYVVKNEDSLFSIIEQFDITIEQFINSNINRYPGLKDNPFLIMKNWSLLIPFIGNGGTPNSEMEK